MLNEILFSEANVFQIQPISFVCCDGQCCEVEWAGSLLYVLEYVMFIYGGRKIETGQKFC